MKPLTRSAGGSRALRAAAVVAATVLLASCTLSSGEPDDDGSEAAAPTGGVTDSVEPSAAPSAEGPSPQELNDDILAAAAAEEQPLGSVSGPASPQEIDTLLEVLEIRPTTDGTLVRMRLSSPSDSYSIGPTTFASGRFGTQNFVRDVYLDDTQAGVRYLPLQFEDYRFACVCPYIPFEVGPEAQEVHALFPPLPDGTTTVDLSLANSGLVVEGLPVGG